MSSQQASGAGGAVRGDADRVKIFDTTLRDGAQTTGVDFSLEDKRQIAGLLDRIGYDPVWLESLRGGRVLQPGGPVFGVVLGLPEFERTVRQDTRNLT